MIPEVKENIEKNMVIIRERVSNCDIDSELVNMISETRNDINKDRYSIFRKAQHEKDEPIRKEYDKKLDYILFGLDDCFCNKKKS
jgi:hypothetical protein